LDGFAVDDKLEFLILQGLVYDKLTLTGTAGALDDDESLSSLHEPRLDLFNVVFSVVPDGVDSIVIVALLATVNDICGITLDPLVPLVVFDVEVASNVSLDEERPNTVKMSVWGRKVHG
jgi:hypothetical protein